MIIEGTAPRLTGQWFFLTEEKRGGKKKKEKAPRTKNRNKSPTANPGFPSALEASRRGT